MGAGRNVQALVTFLGWWRALFHINRADKEKSPVTSVAGLRQAPSGAGCSTPSATMASPPQQAQCHQLTIVSRARSGPRQSRRGMQQSLLSFVVTQGRLSSGGSSLFQGISSTIRCKDSLPTHAQSVRQLILTVLASEPRKASHAQGHREAVASPRGWQETSGRSEAYGSY